MSRPAKTDMRVSGGHGGKGTIDILVYVHDGVLPCGEVADAVAQLTGSAPSQEVLTQRLADRLSTKVKTIGRHLAGAVVTTVVCVPKNEA